MYTLNESEDFYDATLWENLEMSIKNFVEIDKLTECWNWKGLIGWNGYGVKVFKRRRLRAHRFSYGVFNRRFLDSEEGKVLHRCNNKKCVNPEHLYIGTCKDNSRDFVMSKYGGYRNDEKTRARNVESQLRHYKNNPGVRHQTQKQRESIREEANKRFTEFVKNASPDYGIELL